MKIWNKVFVYLMLTAVVGLVVAAVQSYATLRVWYPFEWLVSVSHLDDSTRLNRLWLAIGMCIINAILAFVFSGGLERGTQPDAKATRYDYGRPPKQAKALIVSISDLTQPVSRAYDAMSMINELYAALLEIRDVAACFKNIKIQITKIENGGSHRVLLILDDGDSIELCRLTPNESETWIKAENSSDSEVYFNNDLVRDAARFILLWPTNKRWLASAARKADTKVMA